MWEVGVSSSLLLLLLLLVCSCCGIMFELEPNEKRCLMEAVGGGDLFTGDFNTTELPGLAVAYTVREIASGSLLAGRGLPSSGSGGRRFTVIVEDDQLLEVCFESFRSKDDSHLLQQVQVAPGERHLVSLSMRSVSGNLTEALKASVEALEPMEKILRDCELLAFSALVDFEKMRAKEANMTDTNLSTTNRLFYITLFSIAVQSFSSTWQLLYLHRYFKLRRLI